MASRRPRATSAAAGNKAIHTSTAPIARPQAIADAPVRAVTQRSTRARPDQLMAMQDVLPVVTFSKRRGEQAETSVSRAHAADSDNITVTPRKSATPARTPGSRARNSLFVGDSESDERSIPSQDISAHSQPGDDDDEDSLDPNDIADRLEALDKAANDLITMIMPAADADVTQTQQALLANDNCHRCHNDLVAQRDVFSGENYIDLSFILRKLYSRKPHLLTEQGSWRPDAIIYKANLAQVMYDMLLHGTGRPSEPALNSAEMNFASNVAGPRPQALAPELELNTQLVIARMTASKFQPWATQTIAEDSFISPDGGPYVRWGELGIVKQRPSEQSKHQKSITDRLEILKAASSNKRDNTIRKLDAQFPWSGFKDELVAYCEYRYAELDSQIAIAGHARAIMAAVKNEISSFGPVVPANDLDAVASASNDAQSDAESPAQAAEVPRRTTATAKQLGRSKSGAAAMKQLARKSGIELPRRTPAQPSAVLKPAPGNARTNQPVETNDKPVSKPSKRRRDEPSSQSLEKRQRVATSTPLPEIDDPTQDEGPQDDFETQDVDAGMASRRRDARRPKSVLSRDASIPDVDDDIPWEDDDQGQVDSEADGYVAEVGDEAGDAESAGGGVSEDTEKKKKEKEKKVQDAKESARRTGVRHLQVDGSGNVIHTKGAWQPGEVRLLEQYIDEIGEDEVIEYTGEATGLYHRSQGTIRPKARTMKADRVIINRGTHNLGPGWMQIRLHRETKEKVRSRGIEYNTDDEPEGEGLRRKRPKTRK